MGSMNREDRVADEICLVMGPFDGKQNLMSSATAVDGETGPSPQIGHAPTAARPPLGEGEAQARTQHRCPVARGPRTPHVSKQVSKSTPSGWYARAWPAMAVQPKSQSQQSLWA